MGWFNWGKETKAAGEGVKLAGEGLEAAQNGTSGIIESIRFLAKGDLPPDTVVRLEELALKAEEVKQNIQTGQQEIEKAAIEKGGFNAFFLAGWRPALGWVAVFSIFSYYVPPIILQTIFWVRSSIAQMTLVPFPHDFDIAEILGLVGSLLGMGALRTIEKSSGAQGNH